MAGPGVQMRLWNAREFRAWIDKTARALFGVSGEEFVAGYRDGRWRDNELAHALAASIPLSVSPNESESTAHNIQVTPNGEHEE